VKNWVFEDLDGSQARVIFFGIVTARFLSRAREEKQDRLNLAIVAANNHYAGFGPGTANTFRKMLDLSEVTWNDVEIPNTGERVSSNTKQSSLSDFLK
ncbi:MAG: hypothetical protein WA395_14070, partial [Nitrososphaeraceae archaeon]